ncbi:MAG: hypothetical protein HRU19_29680 [Pseudobacteriovorax sp.]|nr:hypothetical protein [Pseudobacteriovorax sp.]
MQSQFFMGLSVGALSTLLVVGIYVQFIASPNSDETKEPIQKSSDAVPYTEYIGGGSQEIEVDPGLIRGKVVEIIDVEEYTYLKIQNQENELWMATSKIQVNKNDQIEFAENEPFYDFESKTLGRVFQKIYFVTDIKVNGLTFGISQPTEPTPITSEETEYVSKAVSASKKFNDLAQLLAKPEEFADKQIEISGKVVKVNDGIMGRNWIHLVDESIEGQKSDLTVTTQAKVKIGQVVAMRGRLVLDRDFGSGYSYPVILEDAELMKNGD